MKNTRVNVAIRVRPLLDSEAKRGESSADNMLIDSVNSQITISGRVNTSYSFDKVLMDHSQAEVYEKCNIDSYVKQVVDGYHATIFAYGQTGSGKTFTMEGYDYVSTEATGPKVDIVDGEHIGIAPRVIKSIFDQIEDSSKSTSNSYRVYCSFLQLYQEKILDLLNPQYTKKAALQGPGLKLRWNKLDVYTVENLYNFE